MPSSPDVLIIGGGVIGCGIAHELAKSKTKVLLLEKEQVGTGASYASAGMVAPLSDNLEEGPLLELGLRSFNIYQPFLREVEASAGMGVECLPSGIIRTATTEEEVFDLKRSLDMAKGVGIELQYLDGDEARKLEPLLGPRVLAATWSPTEPQLNPSRLVEALRRSAVSRGAVIREQSPVSGMVRAGSRIDGVRVAGETVHAGTIVLATGSWACQAGDWLGFDLPVYPVRGQVVYVNKLARPLQHTIMHGMTYATPKGDSTTLVGSTLEEDVGFDQRVTVAGMASILTRIQDLAPSIGLTTVNHTRAGLRPWSRDHLPVLGPAPGADNLVIAAGHYRSGILLTPVTARMIVDFIVKGAGAVDFGPYSAARLVKAAS